MCNNYYLYIHSCKTYYEPGEVVPRNYMGRFDETVPLVAQLAIPHKLPSRTSHRSTAPRISQWGVIDFIIYNHI